MYELVLRQVEQPLLEAILEHTKGNQSKAAEYLGLNRGTLRKKLRTYNLHK
jgi:Fis family transcriptional regulator